ncbi:MAG: glycine/betaine ABC transporter, partial [Clostridia bacterium]|nr:glycine/betaine ABC transporter [Clostridia bacterium]
ELHILANKNFSAEQPEVAAMLQKFQMTDTQIGSLEGLINDGMDPADAAAQWIADNRGIVDGWLQ